MHSYAQTNIQLYNQLLGSDYPEPDMRTVHAAHQLAIQLFESCFRPNGKAFIAHLVGTASVLLKYQASTPVVCAGLLHAAYSYGEFPDPRRGIRPSKQARLRAVVGNECEELIARYSKLRWKPPTIRRLATETTALSDVESNVIMIRLANEIEDHLDQGMAFGGKSKRYVNDDETLNAFRALATRTGLGDMTEELIGLLCSKAEHPIPDFLTNKESASYSAGFPLNSRLLHTLYKGKRRLTRSLRS